MIAKYVNSEGDEVLLSSFPTRVKDAVFHSYAWGYDGVEKQYGVDITRFTKDPAEYEATIIISGSIEQREKILDDFLETTEKDIIKKTPGKLIVGDCYINAYMLSSSTTPYDNADWTQKEVVFLCPYPFWIIEETRSFPALVSTATTQSDEYLDYEYDLSYDYTAPAGGNVMWIVDHYAPCEFLMTIFGPASEPRIMVNGHTYQVFVDLEANEYLQIDSRNNTVIKIYSGGIKENVYNKRAKDASVFEPIEAGGISVIWSGDFGFDLTLYCERSEPRRTIKNNNEDQSGTNSGEENESSEEKNAFGTTTSTTIDTGLSSIRGFVIYASDSTTGVGLVNVIYDKNVSQNNARVVYCSSSSQYLKIHSYSVESQDFSISGGVIDWQGVENLAFQSGMEYQWFAFS